MEVLLSYNVTPRIVMTAINLKAIWINFPPKKISLWLWSIVKNVKIYAAPTNSRACLHLPLLKISGKMLQTAGNVTTTRKFWIFSILLLNAEKAWEKWNDLYKPTINLFLNNISGLGSIMRKNIVSKQI